MITCVYYALASEFKSSRLALARCYRRRRCYRCRRVAAVVGAVGAVVACAVADVAGVAVVAVARVRVAALAALSYSSSCCLIGGVRILAMDDPQASSGSHFNDYPAEYVDHSEL